LAVRRHTLIKHSIFFRADARRRRGQRITRDWYSIAEQPSPAPHLAHPHGRAALCIVVLTVPCVSRSCEHFPDGFDLLHLSSSFLPSRYRCSRPLIFSRSSRCQKAAWTEEHHTTLLQDEKLKTILDFGKDGVDDKQALDRVRLSFDAENGHGVLVYEV